MSYRVVDPSTIDPGPGPHPAASPYDKRISEALGLTAFEAYLVELPPGAETIEHDHLEDQTQDMYVVVRGHGSLLVDGETVPLRLGQFVAVDVASRRQVRAGDDGLTIVAVCAAP